MGASSGDNDAKIEARVSCVSFSIASSCADLRRRACVLPSLSRESITHHLPLEGCSSVIDETLQVPSHSKKYKGVSGHQVVVSKGNG